LPAKKIVMAAIAIKTDLLSRLAPSRRVLVKKRVLIFISVSRGIGKMAASPQGLAEL